jgi:hypothetical protein
MDKTIYKKISNYLLAFTLWCGDWIKGAGLGHVKQTYHFGDIGIYAMFITVDV